MGGDGDVAEEVGVAIDACYELAVCDDEEGMPKGLMDVENGLDDVDRVESDCVQRCVGEEIEWVLLARRVSAFSAGLGIQSPRSPPGNPSLHCKTDNMQLLIIILSTLYLDIPRSFRRLTSPDFADFRPN